jgi:hypothetical protein
MLEELAEMAFPGGAWVAVGVALGAAFGEQLRPVAKRVVKTGFVVADQVQGIAAEAYERGQDLIAEARYEYEGENGRGKTVSMPPASQRDDAPRRRRSTRFDAGDAGD